MVKIYSKSGCAPCKTLKYWLDQKQIAYEEKDILNSTYMVAPTIETAEGMVIEGLNWPQLNLFLKPQNNQ